MVYDKANVELMKKSFSKFCTKLLYSHNFSISEKIELLNKMYDYAYLYLHYYVANYRSYNYLKKCYFITLMKLFNLYDHKR